MPEVEDLPLREGSPTGPVVRRWVDVVELDPVDGPLVRGHRDTLTAEEPLQIQLVRGRRTTAVAVTMRTPGADFPLVAGFLFTEGILNDPRQISSMRYCVGQTSSTAERNTVTVRLAPGASVDPEPHRRSFYAASSCGVCGKASIEAVRATVENHVEAGPSVPVETILSLSKEIEPRQKVFSRTGGLHAAGLFDPTGRLLSLHEDVGRHNALDKLIGEAWLAGRTPLANTILLVSGRASFEVVQKAARAGIPILAGISAPSSLAVELAEHFGMTLVGFLRSQRFNIYTGRERISGLPTPSRRRG